MLIHLHPDNPQSRNIKAGDRLPAFRRGYYLSYRYHLWHRLRYLATRRAIERICRIKKIQPKEANFSFICRDLSHLSDYAREYQAHRYSVC